ncbi:MAG: hypothetical protein CM15mP102_02530 [Flavobacteriales bacterium]|nr:MAG: hypothetical protein CM15mP102_02530 [Flavobacteriales bacterium]
MKIPFKLLMIGLPIKQNLIHLLITATSAFNMMVNDFVYYFEKGLRTNKIGIPAGRFSSTPLPDKIEAYYYSKIFLVIYQNISLWRQERC